MHAVSDLLKANIGVLSVFGAQPQQDAVKRKRKRRTLGELEMESTIEPHALYMQRAVTNSGAYCTETRILAPVLFVLLAIEMPTRC